MATSMLCDDPLFGSDSLFGGMSLDLEDLFSDDLMGALLGEHGASELLVAPPSCMVPAVVEQPCSSGSGSGTALAARSPSPSRSTTSGQSQGAPVLQLALQRSAGPPTRARRPQGFAVTAAAATAVAPAAATTSAAPTPAAATTVLPAFAKAQELAALLGSAMSDDDDEDSDASNDTDEGAMQQGGKGKSQAGNKRKAPEIDWRSITDPAERRRQRRLAKNRMTAARSRERKKVQWADMEAKLAGLDNDNKRLRAMLQQLASENSTLRVQLEGIVSKGSLSSAAASASTAAPGRLSGHSNSTEPAALVFIAILLLLCCALPGDQAMLLGSAAPMLLLVATLTQSAATGPHGSSSDPSQRQSLASALLRFLASIKLLLARSAIKLRASVHRMLFKRHYHVGRVTLRKTAAWASSHVLTSAIKAEPSEECSIIGLPPLSLSRPKAQVQMVKALAPVEPLAALPSLNDEVLSSFIKSEPFDMPLFDAGAFLVSGLLS